MDALDILVKYHDRDVIDKPCGGGDQPGRDELRRGWARAELRRREVPGSKRRRPKRSHNLGDLVNGLSPGRAKLARHPVQQLGRCAVGEFDLELAKPSRD
ncbi:MAG: hypothetical protein WAL63_18380, partial [Solirubrobacteraceae bacterium]